MKKRLSKDEKTKLYAQIKRFPDYVKTAFLAMHNHIIWLEHHASELELENRSLRQPSLDGAKPKPYVYEPVMKEPRPHFSLDELIARNIESKNDEGLALVLKWHRISEEEAWRRYESYREGTAQTSKDSGDAAHLLQGEPARAGAGATEGHSGELGPSHPVLQEVHAREAQELP